MLDIKRIREDFEGVKERVEYRGKGDFGIGDVKKYDDERRALLADVEAMKHRQTLTVPEHFKIADIDPRGEKAEYLTCSDKARSLSGSVLEAVMHHLSMKHSD